MSKKTKLLWMGLITGLIGIAVTIGLAIATDAIMSREDSTTNYFDKPFDTVVFSGTDGGNIEFHTTQGEYRADAYIKAWRPENIKLANMLSFDIKDGVLRITKSPFPDDFLGMFKQPYELKIDVYSPLGDDLDIRWE